MNKQEIEKIKQKKYSFININELEKIYSNGIIVKDTKIDELKNQIKQKLKNDGLII